MPSKNIIKEYVENSYYHIYNRGVNKMDIFKDPQDYKIFLSYLKTYLSPPEKIKVFPSKIRNNFHNKIKLIAYCLMPNHFHFLIHQEKSNNISQLIQSLNTKYVRYFNTKHNRVGPLYQGKYKAVRITTDEQLLHLSRYIHQNPMFILTSRSDLEAYPYFSLNNYLRKIRQYWIDPQPILNFFPHASQHNAYKSFVFETEEGVNIQHLTLDQET